VAQPPNPTELRKEIEKALLQEFSSKERGYRNDIHRLSEDLKEKGVLILQHDKKMDAAKARCEESKNAATGLQALLDVAGKEKKEIEARLKTLQLTAESQSSNASEIEKMKEQLRHKIEELQQKTKEYANLEHAQAELEISKRNLQLLLEQQQTKMSQDSARIDSLRQETEAERRRKQEQSKNAIDLTRSQTCTLEKENRDLQAKLEHANRRESKLNEAHTALIAERDSLRSRNTELEASKKASASETTRTHEEKVDAGRKYEKRLDTLQRDQERSDAALKEAEAKIQLQKTEYHKKIEFDRQKYESIVKTLTEELSKVKTQATSRSETQQKASQPTSMQQHALHLSQVMQTVKIRKKVSRDNLTVLNVAGLSGFVSALAQGTPRGRNQGFDQSDNLFDEQHDTFGSDNLDRDHGCSIVDPTAVLVEDTQDIGGVLPPFVDDAQDVGGAFLPLIEETQDTGGALPLFGNVANQAGQKPCDDSSLSSPMTSDDLNQLLEDSQAVCTPVLKKHHRTQLHSHEMIPETPIRQGSASLSGSYSSKSHGRPGSQANTASRLMPPPGTVSAHFNQLKSSPAARSKDVSRQHTSTKPDHSRGRGNDSSSGSEDRPFPLFKGSYDTCGSAGNAQRSPEHSLSQKRKLNFDQDVTSKRQRTPSQSLSQRLSPGFRSYSPHRSHSKPSRPSVGRENARSQASPSPNDILIHSSGSSDHTRHISSQTPSTKPASKSRSQQSSTSKSSVSSHTARLYGRHQTRSKGESFPPY
jgi:hypothetical protein